MKGISIQYGRRLFHFPSIHCRTFDPLISKPRLHEKKANSPSLDVINWPLKGGFKVGHNPVSVNTY